MSKHIYTVATTILVDIESDQELTDANLRNIMNECDYEFRAEGRFGPMWNENRYRVGDLEFENWKLVAMREENRDE
jgi:hypothetical protein